MLAGSLGGLAVARWLGKDAAAYTLVGGFLGTLAAEKAVPKKPALGEKHKKRNRRPA